MDEVFYGLIVTKGRESVMLTFLEHEYNYYQFKCNWFRDHGYLVAQYELQENGKLIRVNYNSI